MRHHQMIFVLSIFIFFLINPYSALNQDHKFEFPIDHVNNPLSRQLLDLSTIIANLTSIIELGSIQLLYDPPLGHFSPTALGVYVEVVGQPSALVYYTFDAIGPSLSSSYASFTSPYIQIDTPFAQSRVRPLTIVAVYNDPILGIVRSKQHKLTYYVESSNRPLSYGFFVPGIESSGYFLRIKLEEVATARAQIVGNQEFADYFNRGSKGTLGTYKKQIQALHLPSLDPDLIGFEGGYAVNVSGDRHYGILVPYHNGKRYFGKVVRVNMTGMANATSCYQSYRMESYNLTSNQVIHTGTTSIIDACIVVLDLSSLHPQARGYRRGFVGYPYMYLSPGEFNVLVRIDMENYSIAGVDMIDLDRVNKAYGGYSGGFVDGSWACFNPFRTFYGPVGGLRSSLPVDAHALQPYFHGNMICINSTGWSNSITNINYHHINSSIRTLNPANISPDYRGFADVIRVGRYVYFCPYATDNHVYTGKLIRIYLGSYDIGHQIDALYDAQLPLSSIVDVLDLKQVDSQYAGFSSLFTSGIYLYLVPYRNDNILYNGQRGHGHIIKINMNDFDLSGVEALDLTITTRNQIPSFADVGLCGFSYGFASGKYGVYVPFYNGVFSGKAARVQLHGSADEGLADDLQSLDLAVDRMHPGSYKGYRGAFVSIWPGTTF